MVADRIPPPDGDQLRAAPANRRALARLIDFTVGIGLFTGSVLIVEATAPSDIDGTGLFLTAMASTTIVYFLYEVTFVAACGATIGKLLLGLRVERLAKPGQPGLTQSFLRNLIPTAALLIFFPAYPFVYLAAFLSPARRGPVDLVGRTRVVRFRKRGREQPYGSGARRVRG